MHNVMEYRSVAHTPHFLTCGLHICAFASEESGQPVPPLMSSTLDDYVL